MSSRNGFEANHHTEYDDQGFHQENGIGSVASYPQFEYSMSKVRLAGDALKEEIIWSSDREAEIHEIFAIANNWRDSHAYPMTKIRSEAVGLVRKLRVHGLVSARLKRMRSIRKKLRVNPGKLAQIQDLGGCRIILPSMANANAIISALQNDPKHELFGQDDYIANPKRGGYRSHHLKFKFLGAGKTEVFNGRRIEMQVRSRLQHSWATAVEAVGMLRSEDMKAGQGDADWLRLFDLISAELAMTENCPEPPDLPGHADRIKEIRYLDKRLNAIVTLEGMRHAVNYADNYLQDPDYQAKYYLVTFNNATRQVKVRPYREPREGTDSYSLAEADEIINNTSKLNTVLVEAGKVANLQEAYPNYFGDVRVFTQNLKAICDGKMAKEYTMPPQAVPPRPPVAVSDMSWARRTGRRR